jgi:hypothetical protein
VWSEQDLDLLLTLPCRAISESRRCHDAGSPLAALVMLTTAFEAVLLGMVITYEDQLRADEQMPKRPSRVHLDELSRLAQARGWLTEPAMDEVLEILNKSRTMAAHPGAYVRALRQVPELDLRASEGWEVCYGVVVKACEQLSAALKRDSSPANGESGPGETATGSPRIAVPDQVADA